MSNEPEATNLNDDERAFLERLNRSYAPPEWTASQGVAFRQRLEDRIERRRAGYLAPLRVAVGAAAAAVVLWLTLPGSSPIVPGVDPQIEVAQAATEDDELIAWSRSEELERDESLPDEYEAIASLLLDGA